MYNAQTCQDIFVDKVLNKTNGFFVDIGAGTGGLPAHTPGFYRSKKFAITYFAVVHSWLIKKIE